MKKLILLCVVAMSLTACGSSPEEFDTWVDDCYQMDGVPQITSAYWYECFVDGKQVLVPGYGNKH